MHVIAVVMDFLLPFLLYLSCSEALIPSRQTEGQREEIFLSQRLVDDQMSSVAEESCTDLWFTPKNGTCHCGDTIHDAVTCNEHTKEVMVLDCYCMTADSATNQTVVGNCLFNCFSLSRNALYLDNVYHQAPSDCSYLNRKGTLCGECKKHSFPRAYSYKLDCIQCHHPDSWWLYTAAAFLPLTVFIIIILVFRISVVSPKLHAFVFFAQRFAAPANVRILLATKYTSPIHVVLVKLFTCAYGIWNLDFFRTVLPNICLHLTTLQVLALDYLIAVYPMLLMVIAYTLVELHGYGFKPVLLMWKPFHYFLARFRREWDIQTSIVDAFVTFFILSTTKILSASYDLLIPTELYGANGDFLGLRLYYDPNVEYFKHEHLPYALLALAVFSLFILLPFCLLVLPSFHCVRKCFSKWRIRIRVLEDFLYAFQQYYRDDSNKMTDCRWYAGFYILVTFSLFLTYAFTLSGFTYILYIFLFTIGAVTILIVQPYKEEYAIYNVVDCVLFLCLALFCAVATLVNFAEMFDRVYLAPAYLIMAFLCAAPLVYIIAVVIYWMLKRTGWKFCSEASLDESLPDRVCRSREYRDNFGSVSA